MKKRPIIDITDLYHMPQDVGDNVDIIAAYALEPIDLRAVILDVTDRFRAPRAQDTGDGYTDLRGYAREPGIIPMTQMNYIFDRDVPFAPGPFAPMRSVGDTMEDIPEFEQTGVRLLLDTLRKSDEPVDILSFGSARALAVAYNREPRLLREKIGRIHLSAGASSEYFAEWNVCLDRLAIVTLLSSDLPIALYPCATQDGPFAYGEHNTFWRLTDMEFIRDMAPSLRRYLGYALGNVNRVDFLRAMQEDLPDEVMQKAYQRPHNVWETAIWLEAAGLSLVQKPTGEYRIVGQVQPGDRVLPGQLMPCRTQVQADGMYSFTLTQTPGNRWIYHRGDPMENERALRQALPALYTSFRPVR